MSVPVARRIVVGVDFSAESAAALRWACREAGLRGAEVHAVHAREAPCHSMASYAVPVQDQPDDIDTDVMWRSVMPEPVPGVQVRTEIVEGLAARILLDRSEGADMLILGTASDTDDALRSAGPVIRACLRRALCPVVVISVAQEPLPRDEMAALDTDVRVPAGVGAGSGTHHAGHHAGAHAGHHAGALAGAGAGAGGGVRIPAPAMAVPAAVPAGVPAGA